MAAGDLACVVVAEESDARVTDGCLCDAHPLWHSLVKHHVVAVQQVHVLGGDLHNVPPPAKGANVRTHMCVCVCVCVCQRKEG